MRLTNDHQRQALHARGWQMTRISSTAEMWSRDGASIHGYINARGRIDFTSSGDEASIAEFLSTVNALAFESEDNA